MDGVKCHFVKTNGITLHVAAAGPENGQLIVLLHGFPEFWYGWKNQIKPLADAGYRVIAPDQRGYNLSDKPDGIDSYRIDTLRDDIIGLISQFTDEKAIVIGHDWGGAVAWHLASTRPEYLEKLIAINIPHPYIMKTVTPIYPPQWLKSSYIAFFQLPDIPEASLKENDYETLDKAIGLSDRPELFTSEDVSKYKEAWKQPGALTAMLNWYRALRKGSLSEKTTYETAPYRMIWGMEDRFLSRKLAKETERHCTNGHLIFVDEASHWINHEKPAIVNHLILEYLKKQ
ncbi:alpha/beta hydrolase [Bacillus spizizenii]|uniref:alpha/beta fold hydrolase n=1 Tax=Bacillus spizizenii TaxID=96241 RepID=UPI0005CA0E44|nr:alpha/beta hydrolase [Bacillus spizizenii]MCY7832883.1 alpha/beta hydrolase [Bacillus spizizenii]MCY8107037.1 alpha/beta hydrolase [Bacillus spizizenii]MCY8116910.1 alpha/beta hydrolase [Bacillus spizizenii]MCY8130738.1 alpha/beta hydrolase [Bacillus spizizenii]MCY8305334.1 alpha/beta hydrolase [Bacillus spizizenii]